MGWFHFILISENYRNDPNSNVEKDQLTNLVNLGQHHVPTTVAPLAHGNIF
jgi:hypothetical protein